LAENAIVLEFLRDAEPSGYFTDRLLLEVEENQHLSVARRDFRETASNHGLGFVGQHLLQRGDDIIGFLRWSPLSQAPANGISTQVSCDAREPWAGAAAVSQVGKVSPCLDERFLRHVFCEGGIAGDAERYPVYQPTMLPHQSGEFQISLGKGPRVNRVSVWWGGHAPILTR
jgi:hypothetical protein